MAEDDEQAEYCWVCGEDGHSASVACQRAAGMID